MDNEAHHVVLGAVDHSTRLLDLRWGHGELSTLRYLVDGWKWGKGSADVGSLGHCCYWLLVFFTGSTGVGRVVAMATAKNLVPCTLEVSQPCLSSLDH